MLPSLVMDPVDTAPVVTVVTQVASEANPNPNPNPNPESCYETHFLKVKLTLTPNPLVYIFLTVALCSRRRHDGNCAGGGRDDLWLPARCMMIYGYQQRA